jgi:hypothetical protein
MKNLESTLKIKEKVILMTFKNCIQCNLFEMDFKTTMMLDFDMTIQCFLINKIIYDPFLPIKKYLKLYKDNL